MPTLFEINIGRTEYCNWIGFMCMYRAMYVTNYRYITNPKKATKVSSHVWEKVVSVGESMVAELQNRSKGT